MQVLPTRHWWQTKLLESRFVCVCGRKTGFLTTVKQAQCLPALECSYCGRLAAQLAAVEEAATAIMHGIRLMGERN